MNTNHPMEWFRGLVVLAVGLAVPAWAANGTWTQTVGGAYNWSDSGNWSGGTVAGGSPGDTAALTANLDGPVTINLGSPITLGAITIGDPTSTFYNYTINPNGGSFVLNNLGSPATITKFGGAATPIDAIHADIALSDNLTIKNDGFTGTTLHLGGVISGAGKTVTVNNGFSTRNLLFTGSSTYSGKTVLTRGDVFFNSLANADGTASAFGAPENATDGTITWGAATVSVLLKYIGSGHSSDRVLDLANTTGPMFLDASGSGPLTLTSGLTATGIGNKTLTLTGTGIGALGAIPDAAGGTVVTLSKTGTGTWNLMGNNTFTGTITVNSAGGTLGIGHDNALSTSALTLTAGSLTAVGGPRTINNTITAINSGFSFSGTEDLSLTATIPMSPAGNKTFYNNLVSGKTLTLGAMNLADGSARTTTFAGTGDTTITGVIANGGAGAGSLVKAGRGTLTLKGANTYTGTTLVQGGTLLVDYTTGSLPLGGALTFGATSDPFRYKGYGTLTLQGASGVASAQTLGNLTLANPTATGPGAGTLRLVGVGGGSMTLTLGDTWNRTTGMGSSLHIDMSSGTSTLTSSPVLINGVVGGNIGYAFVTVTDATKTGFATVSGGNIVRYASATTLAAGSDNGSVNYVTKVGDAGYAGSTLTLTAASPVNASTLELDTSAGSGVLDLNTKTLAIDKYGLLVTGANGFTIQNGTVGGGTAGANELIIHQYASGTLTISAAAGSGSGFIAKTGPGTLVLSGASTATGTTRVNQGVLRLDNATGGGTGSIAIQAGAALELNGVAVGNRPLPTLSGDGISGNGAIRCVGVADSSYGGLITVVNQGGRISADSSRTLTLTGGIAVTAAGDDVTFGGAGDIVVSTNAITGAGGLIKDGAGTATLSMANTYSGATMINAGTLLVNNTTNSGTGTGAITVGASGTLGGSGRIAPTGANGVTVSSGGKLAPGESIGKLEFNFGGTTGGLSMSGGSIFAYELGPAGATIADPVSGVNSDTLIITGAAAGDVVFNNNVIDFLGTGEGGYYKLFDTDGGAAIWAGLTFSGQEIIGGLSVTNLASLHVGTLLLGDGAGNGDLGDIYLQVVATAIPEPASATLLALAGLALLRRRRQAQRA